VPESVPIGYSESVNGLRSTKDSADFIAKLRQIEEQANSVNAEMAPGVGASDVPKGEVRSVTSEARIA
jgi:hypothetical protein